MVPGTEPMTLCVPGKHSTIEPHTQLHTFSQIYTLAPVVDSV